MRTAAELTELYRGPNRVYIVLRRARGWCCGHHHKRIDTALACKAKQPLNPKNYPYRQWDDYYVVPVTRKDDRLPLNNDDHKALGSYHFMKAMNRLPEPE